MTLLSPLRLLQTALLLTAFDATPAVAAPWKVDAAKSQLSFSGIQTGTAFKGRFTRFSTQIDFDPDHPETSHIAVVIDTASATTGDAQRDGALPGKDWFDITRFPQAKFETTAIRKTGANDYEATGNLTLRDITQPVTLPFRLQITGSIAHAKGRLSLVRTWFGVGQGPWSSGQWVALDVEVDVDIVAAPAS